MPRTSDRGPLLAPLAALPLALLWLASACVPEAAGHVACNSDFECGSNAHCAFGVCEKLPLHDDSTPDPNPSEPDAGPVSEPTVDAGEPDPPFDAGMTEPEPDAGPSDGGPSATDGGGGESDAGAPDPDPIPTRFDLAFDVGMHGDDALSMAPVAIHLPAGHPLANQLLDGRRVRLMLERDGTVAEAPLDVERVTAGGAVLWTRLQTAPALLDAAWLESFSAGPADFDDRSTEVWSDYDAVYHLAGDASDATGRWSSFVANGTEVIADCPTGACRAFDGDDWIDLSSPDGDLAPWLQGVDGFTVEAWIRREADTDTEVVSVGTGATGSGPTASRAAIMYRSGAPGGFARAPDALGSKLSSAAEPDTLGVWHHVALVVRLPDAAEGMGSVQVFEDGEEVTYSAGPEHLFEEATTNTDGAVNVALGADDDGSALWLVGAIDEVRIKPTPCTAAALRAALWTASTDFVTVDEGTLVDEGP